MNRSLLIAGSRFFAVLFFAAGVGNAHGDPVLQMEFKPGTTISYEKGGRGLEPDLFLRPPLITLCSGFANITPEKDRRFAIRATSTGKAKAKNDESGNAFVGTEIRITDGSGNNRVCAWGLSHVIEGDEKPATAACVFTADGSEYTVTLNTFTNDAICTSGIAVGDYADSSWAAGVLAGGRGMTTIEFKDDEFLDIRVRGLFQGIDWGQPYGHGAVNAAPIGDPNNKCAAGDGPISGYTEIRIGCDKSPKAGEIWQIEYSFSGNSARVEQGELWFDERPGR